MSTISAGTSVGTALVSTGDTTGQLDIQVNGTTQALRINTSGAIGVGTSPAYGTSGQVLTSGGSGAAPTWSNLPPGAGSFTAVASGSISAGAPVSINSDGTVSTSGFVTNSAPTTYTSTVLSGTSRCSVAKKPGTNFLLAAEFGSSSGGNRITVRILQIVGTQVVSTASTTQLDGGAITSPYTGSPTVVYEPVSDTFVVTYVDGNGYLAAQAVSVNFTTSNFTVGSKVVLSSNPFYSCTCFYTTGGAVVAAGNRYSPTGAVVVAALTVSGTTISAGAAQVATMDGLYVNGTYNTAANAFVITTNAYTGSSYEPRAVAGTLSGTSVTLGSVTTIEAVVTSSNFGVFCNYDTSASRTVAFYWDDTTDTIRARVLSLSGTTITLGTVAVTAGTDYGNVYSSVFSTAGSVNLVSVITLAGTFRFLKATISGTTVTFQSPTTALSAYFFPRYDTDTAIIYYTNSGTVTPITALTSSVNSFAGFSSANYTNGQTATINSVGSINTSQTGLTPGVNYELSVSGGYVAGAKTSAAYIGTALSATSILVRG